MEKSGAKAAEVKEKMKELNELNKQTTRVAKELLALRST